MQGSILITGASSGLGAALARYYAQDRAVLFLAGRNHARLNEVAETCRQKGAIVHVDIVDVTDQEACARWVERAIEAGPIGLIIANAGISGSFERGHTDDIAVLQTNVMGVANVIVPALPHLKHQGKGQIAIISSLASFYPFADGAAYSASKAAVRFYGEGLRTDLSDSGISVSVVCPGFIATPLIEGQDFPMPLLMTADRAAKIIADRLARRRGRIAFPQLLYWPLRLIAALPLAWTGWWLQRKTVKR